MGPRRLAWAALLAVGLAPLACGGGTAGGPSYDIAVDPYGTSPLVAVINLRAIEESEVRRVEVVVAGQDGAPDFLRTYVPADTKPLGPLDTSDLTFPEPGTHVPVLGLYADRKNEVRIHVDRFDRDGVDLTLQIEAPLAKPGEAAWVPSIRINSAVPELMEPGWTVAEISIEPNPSPPVVFVDWTRSIAFDERGAIRWALRLDALPKGETFTLRRSITGNFLTGSLDTIVEVTKLGRTTRSFRLPDHTLNHEILQIGSEDNGEGVSDGTKSGYVGNLLVLASKNGASTVEDHVLEIDAETGAVLEDWDLAQVFESDPNDLRRPGGVGPRGGGLAPRQRARLLRGGRINHRFGSPPRRGEAPSRRNPGLAARAAQGVEGAADREAAHGGEPSGHAVRRSRAAWGRGRGKFDGTGVRLGLWPALARPAPQRRSAPVRQRRSRHWGPPYASFSRAVVYRIDEAAMTVSQVGQFVLTRAESSYFISNTHQLP